MAKVDFQFAKVKTGEIRFSYLNVLKPREDEKNPKFDKEGNKIKKYGCMLLIPKSDADTVNAIKKAIDEQIAHYKTVTGKAKLPATFKTPLHDGDDTDKEGEHYEGHYYMNCSSINKPGIVGLMKGTDGKFNALTDEKDVYSGMYGRATLNFFAFGLEKGSDGCGVGVGVGLNNIQKLRDGDRLGGGFATAEDDFDDDVTAAAIDSDDEL